MKTPEKQSNISHPQNQVHKHLDIPQSNMDNQPTFSEVWANIHNQLDSIHRQKIQEAKDKFAKEKEYDQHHKRN